MDHKVKTKLALIERQRKVVRSSKADADDKQSAAFQILATAADLSKVKSIPREKRKELAAISNQANGYLNVVSANTVGPDQLKKIERRLGRSAKAVVASVYDQAHEPTQDQVETVRKELTEKIVASADFEDVERLLRDEMTNQRNKSIFDALKGENQSLDVASKKAQAKTNPAGLAFAAANIVFVSNAKVSDFERVGIKAEQTANYVVLKDQRVIAAPNEEAAREFIEVYNTSRPGNRITMVVQKPSMYKKTKQKFWWVMHDSDLNRFKRVNNIDALNARGWGFIQ